MAPLPPPGYERDPRCKRLDTDVVEGGEEKGRPFVILADTVLCPEGGGQPADRGTVGGVDVVDVQKVDGVIRHTLAGPAPSGRVTVELDWVRRFDHMQQHTGQHLLTAVADQRFGWHTTAFHLGAHVSDIELDAPVIGPDDMDALEEAVAAQIRRALPVTTRRVTDSEYASLPVRSRGLPAGHTGSVRLVEIEGIDLNTCGGTHCSSTAELEALKLLGTESMRGGTRLFYAAGGRLRRIHAAHHRRNARLRELLGTGDDQLVDGVRMKLDQLREAQRACREMEDDLASVTAEGLAARPGTLVVEHWPGRELPFLQRVARTVGELAPDRIVFLTSGKEEEGAFVLAAGEDTGTDLAALGRQVADVLGGRGGGSGRLFQGKATRLSGRTQASGLLEAHLSGR